MKDKIDTPVFIVFLIGAFVFSCITFVLGIWVCDSSHKIDKQLTDVKVMDNYSEDNITADDLFKDEFSNTNKDETKIDDTNEILSEQNKNKKNTITQSDLIKKNNEIKKNKDKPNINNIKKSESKAKSANTSKKNITKKTNKKKNEKPKTISKKQFYIQIIATSKKSVAEKEKIRFERKGYNVFLVKDKVKGKNIYKVRIGTFKTKEQAKKIASKIAKEFNIKPWVI